MNASERRSMQRPDAQRSTNKSMLDNDNDQFGAFPTGNDLTFAVHNGQRPYLCCAHFRCSGISQRLPAACRPHQAGRTPRSQPRTGPAPPPRRRPRRAARRRRGPGGPPACRAGRGGRTACCPPPAPRGARGLGSPGARAREAARVPPCCPPGEKTAAGASHTTACEEAGRAGRALGRFALPAETIQRHGDVARPHAARGSERRAPRDGGADRPRRRAVGLPVQAVQREREGEAPAVRCGWVRRDARDEGEQHLLRVGPGLPPQAVQRDAGVAGGEGAAARRDARGEGAEQGAGRGGVGQQLRAVQRVAGVEPGEGRGTQCDPGCEGGDHSAYLLGVHVAVQAVQRHARLQRAERRRAPRAQPRERAEHPPRRRRGVLVLQPVQCIGHVLAEQ
eukprot:gene459-biopygen10639